MRNHTNKLPLLIIGIFLFLAGCSTQYKIEGEYPRPLVESIPIQVDLSITDAFNSYVYEEDREDRKKLNVNLGEAQTTLFQTITDTMFVGTTEDPLLRITPSVEGFQYAIPRETRAEIYEVWLKYRVKIEEEDGTPIADWLMTGYGKTPSAFLRSQKQAINSAANIALRDIGTQLSIGFKRQPDISLWLAKDNEETSP